LPIWFSLGASLQQCFCASAYLCLLLLLCNIHQRNKVFITSTYRRYKMLLHKPTPKSCAMARGFITVRYLRQCGVYVRLVNVPANALAYFFFSFFVSLRSFLSSDFTFLSIFLRSSSAGKFSGLIPLFNNSPLTS
jgi:hypothetical protein